MLLVSFSYYLLAIWQTVIHWQWRQHFVKERRGDVESFKPRPWGLFPHLLAACSVLSIYFFEPQFPDPTTVVLRHLTLNFLCLAQYLTHSRSANNRIFFSPRSWLRIRVRTICPHIFTMNNYRYLAILRTLWNISSLWI